jgi:hypothetical protein
MAIQCLALIREKLPIVLSLADFFENPTVAQQAALVRERLSAAGRNGTAAKQSSPAREPTLPQPLEAPVGPRTIPARGRNLPYPLSSGQHRIWLFEEMAPGVPLYNESEAVRLVGELHAEALEQSLNLVIKRHEILRTTIQIAAEQPIAVVHENWPLRIKRIGLEDFSPQREAEVQRLLIDEPRLPYHLETEPGIRATLVRLSSTEHVFILMMHHLVCDWASEGVLWRELSSAYRAICRGEPVNTDRLPIQYCDFAVWQQQRVDEGGFAEDLVSARCHRALRYSETFAVPAATLVRVVQKTGLEASWRNVLPQPAGRHATPSDTPPSYWKHRGPKPAETLPRATVWSTRPVGIG